MKYSGASGTKMEVGKTPGTAIRSGGALGMNADGASGKAKEMYSSETMREAGRLVRALFGVLADKVADFVFPPDIYCISCGRPIAAGSLYSLCDDCLQEIRWANGKLCRVCGKLLEDWYPRNICGTCANQEHSFDRGVSCVQYGENERQIIADFKYRGKSYLARTLSEILYDKISALGFDFDFIIPVPMYAPKEKKRGYNQAALLGRYLGQRMGKICRTDCLYRVRETVPMSKLGARERRRNLDNAFEVSRRGAQFIRGKCVLLIDDIYTTGTTAEHCASLLKAHGCREIIVASVAASKNQKILRNMQNEKDEPEAL